MNEKTKKQNSKLALNQNEFDSTELKFRTLFESSSDAIMLLDEQGFFDCNNSTLKIFGCKTKEEFCLKHPAELSPKNQPNGVDSMTLANRKITDAFKNGSNRFDWMHQRTNGEEFPAEVLLNAMKIGDSNVLQAVVRDITDRKKMQKALKESEELLSSTIASMDDLIFVLDKNGVFINYYPPDSTSKLYLSPEQFINKSYKDVLPSNIVEKTESAIDKLRENSTVQQYDYFLEISGEKKWFNMKISIRKDNLGKYAGIVAVARDITDRKKIEEKLKNASNVKSMFLANMSHEIKTPMNAIIGFAALLFENESNPKRREWLNIINKAGKSLLQIINDILDFSKIEDGNVEFKHAEIDLHELLGQIRSTFDLTAQEKNIIFDVKIDHTVPQKLLGDESKINQILKNLVNNAIKFTDQGTVVLKCSYLSKKIRFEVIDSGIGISEENKSEIFSPFKQADNSTTRKYGGTGLGLSITKKLVEGMNGTLTFSSIEGKGSTFVVELPEP